MPITGIFNFVATFLASSAGIFSSTIEKHPVSSRTAASSNNFSASAFSLALTVYVPNLYIYCGVNPRCPITGMPAVSILSTDSIISLPPSNLTACAPDSFIILIEDSRATRESP